MEMWRESIRRSFSRAGRVVDDQVLDELNDHARSSYAAARADGSSADEARARVEQEIASWAGQPEPFPPRPSRPAVVPPPPATNRQWAGLLRDVQYALRLMRRRPASWLVGAAMMACGIAATTTLFSLTWNVLVKPLPWSDPDRLVTVVESREGSTRQLAILTNVVYHAWAADSSTIEAIGAYSRRTYTRWDTDDNDRVQVVAASASLMPMLGARPIDGRLLGEGDEQVAVLSHGYWRRHYGGASDVVGQSLRLDDRQYEIVGVTEPRFAFPDNEVELWIPYTVPPTSPGSLSMFSAIAKLRPGVTLAQASREAVARARTAPDPGMVVQAVFGTDGPVVMQLTPLLEAMVGDVRSGLVVVLAGVALLMVTAIASLAGLQLARVTGRRRELAIRAAVGAGRGRIARQLLAEALLMGGVGGLAGWLLTLGLHGIVPTLLPAGFPRLDDFSADAGIAAFAVGLTVGVSLLVSLLPVWQAGRLHLVPALIEDGLAPVGYGRRSPAGRSRALLIVGQVAVASLLLVGAGLLAQTLISLQTEDLGYRPDGILTGLVVSSPSVEPGQVVDVIEPMVQRLAAMPGVEAVAVATALPLRSTGEGLWAFQQPVANSDGDPVTVSTTALSVSPEYFRVLGMRLIQGRWFTDADQLVDGPRPVVVNRAFADAYLGSRALGPLQLSETTTWNILGVAENVRQPADEVGVGPTAYAMYVGGEDRGYSPQPYLLLRTDRPVEVAASAMRAVAAAMTPAVALDRVMALDERLGSLLSRQRLYAVLVVAFATFALVIAVVGLFGMLSSAVAQRTREIGVRTALGATPGSIVRLIAAQGLTLVLAGVATGLATAVLLMRFLASLLAGVTPYDPLTFAVVPLIVVLAGALACLLPARRAAATDPLKALRT